MKNITSFIAGLIFGIGLLLSGMSNPVKVESFLDLFGVWDPSLIFVILGAIGIGSIGFFLAKKRTYSLLGETMQIPTSKKIDAPLVIGSLIFGVGWGLAGICPGPALVTMGAGIPQAFIFGIAMFSGMAFYQYFIAKN